MDREKKKAYDRECRAKNKDKARAYRAKYNAQNKDKIKVYQAWYYIQNKEAIKAKQEEYRAERKELIKAHTRQWAIENPERVRQNKKNWVRKHPEKLAFQRAVRRARLRNTGVSLTEEQWQTIKNMFKQKCVYCGKRTRRLAKDHIIPLSQGGDLTLQNIVPACQSCNSKKGTKSPLKPIQVVLL